MRNDAALTRCRDAMTRDDGVTYRAPSLGAAQKHGRDIFSQRMDRALTVGQKPMYVNDLGDCRAIRLATTKFMSSTHRAAARPVLIIVGSSYRYVCERGVERTSDGFQGFLIALNIK